MTKVILQRFLIFYGIFPGNDVIQTELLKYCSLIGYCHGGREIHKTELWESFVWKDSSIWLCVAKYHFFKWPKSAYVHADFPPMDSKRMEVCCYRRRSLQWRKEACPIGIVCECTEPKITWGTTTTAPQDSFAMEGAEISNYSTQISYFTVCYHLFYHLEISFYM